MSDKQINRLFEALAPTSEQKEKMFHNIVVHSQNEAKRQSRFTPARRLRPALLCAILIGCLTTTALAAAYIGLDDAFLKFLKPANQEQAQFLSNGAYVIDKQIKNENGTLTMKQVVGDSNRTFILMNFTAPEGTVLDADEYRFESTYLRYDRSGKDRFGYSSGFDVLDDGHPDDNNISLIMKITTKNSLAGRTFDFEFENLQIRNPLTKDFETIIPGTWKTTVKLDFKEYSNVYQIDQDIDMYGYKAVLKTISISPISITLKLESNSLEEISNNPDRGVIDSKSLDNFPITINYKDGTSETTNFFTGSVSMDLITGQMFTNKTFKNVINDKGIKSIVFFNKEFPIND
ncbi:hypothetical protein BBG47_00075 [Paenibacillus sp. KS1]|uniref:DUF4179 domain-containing protein n=1 Tax=Paenibacillus sp. KS1 TaxID=1849249 RepID=UPI0008065614|nr:DUF4179 domain-containing protein [Paenibacillus sp. KS1]OBY81517.1 hypothetical protein BBG47_00075 [Paenibacillus sp. KS1]